MWQKFIQWLTSLFGSEDPEVFLAPDEPEYSFNGVIKDEVDPRDHVFTVEQK